MSWLRRLLGLGAAPAARSGGDAPDTDTQDDDGAFDDGEAFACSTCGRTDLPEAGGWDPPICLECDAAINFDAIEEVDITEDW